MRYFLSLFVSSVVALSASAAPPNMVFILADDLGYGDLGCYGQKKIQTPNLDKLAADGMRFTQVYAGSTVCAPSRCTLMTGLHTGHCRIRGNATVPLASDDVTVARVLQKGGYVTGCIGKWGLGEANTTGIPTKQGFDYYFGFLNQVHAHNYYPDYLWRGEVKVPLKNVQEKGIASKRVEYAPDLLREEAIAFIEKNKEKTFFLYYTPTLPHVNNEKTRADGNGNEVPDDKPYTNEKWPQPEKDKAAMITRLDADVGKLLSNLTELGLDKNTLIIFTSDNGPHKEGGNTVEFLQSSGPLRGLKRDLTEGGIRVPAIVRWPGVVKAGTTSDQVWAFWDVFPTLCEVAGAKAPNNLDGISFLPTLTGQGKQQTHDFLYWEFHEGGTKQAVRHDDWKAIRLSPSAPLELYDLATDIGEKKNVAKDHPEVIAKIEEYLKSARTKSKDWPIQEPKKKK